jgi:hypothetical protein
MFSREKLAYYLEWLVYILLSIGFLGAFISIMIKWESGPKTTLVEIDANPTLLLPALTFCTEEAFKVKGYHYR